MTYEYDYYNIFWQYIDTRHSDKLATGTGSNQFGESSVFRTSWFVKVYEGGRYIRTNKPPTLEIRDVLHAYKRLCACARHRRVGVIEFFKDETQTMLVNRMADLTTTGHLIPRLTVADAERLAA
jgi:hypothetical protein